MTDHHQDTAAVAAAAAAATAAATAESSELQTQQQQNTPQNSNPFLNIFSNFLKLFNLVPPPPQQKKKNQADDPTKVSPVVVDEVETKSKPTVVSFPRHKDENLPSLKLEPEEIEERNTNPVVLWQVSVVSSSISLFF